MGLYVNPGNEGFATVRRSRYVDKSGLIAVVNDTIGKKNKLSLISRSRRFGKSFDAYFCYRDNFIRMEELASGKGYVDMVFIPRAARNLPAVVIELKWNNNVRTAMDQIRNRDYPAVLKNFTDKILLVGISYDKDDVLKKHSCVIEELNTDVKDL